MNLPDSFGIDTIKTILAKYPGNMVIVLTGLTDEEVGLETVRYGAQDFLTKGKFDSKVLISSIMFAFERFKLNKEIDSVSQKLSEENSRFVVIQHLLNIGYLEYDKKTNLVYRSDNLLKLAGINTELKNQSLEDVMKFLETDVNMPLIIEKGGAGEFEYSKEGKKFRLIYETQGDKICAVVQPL